MGRAEDIFERLLTEGEAVIDEFIETRQAEELFLEFKQSADHGSGSKLHPTDRQRLAEAISGFGNSEGGVLVWGVECTNVATQKRPLVDVHKFTSWLQHAVSGCTVPPHGSVRHHSIVRGASGHGGFVATLIPKSDHAPHQVTGRNQYYIRAGSSFMPVPHGVLAGLFGRRPQPHVFHMYTPAAAKFDGQMLESAVGIQVVNNGPGVADDLFLNVTCLSVPGARSRFSFEPTHGNWEGNIFLDAQVSMISNVGVRLPPEARHQPLLIHLGFLPPFTQDLHFVGMCGAGNSLPSRFKLHNTAERITELYTNILANNATSSGVSRERLQQVTSEILGLP